MVGRIGVASDLSVRSQPVRRLPVVVYQSRIRGRH